MCTHKYNKLFACLVQIEFYSPYTPWSRAEDACRGLCASPPQGQSSHSPPFILRFSYSRSSLNAKLDETVPLKCDEPYITPSMVSLSAPVVTSSDGHGSTATAAYSQSNIVRVSAL